MEDDLLHATCVAVDGRAALIKGPSGSGKSALGLQLLALGAALVADDKTRVAAQNGALWATAPDTIAGMIEARGVGLLRMPHLDRAEVALMVDLSHHEPDRLPRPRHVTLQGIVVPVLYKVDAPYFPSAIRAYLVGTVIEAP